MKNRALLLVGTGTALLYVVILGLQPVLLISNPRLLELSPWLLRFVQSPPDLPEPARTVFVFLHRPAVTATLWCVLVASLFALYGAAWRAARRGTASVAVVLGGFVVFAAVLAPGIPVFSSDIFSYVAHGELVDTKHVSPYEVRLEDHRDLAVARWSPRLRLGSVYGPLALRAFQGLHVSGASPWLNLLVFKAAWIVALLAAQLLVYRTLRDLGREPREACALLVLFAWNPLVLADGVLNGHVDVMIALLLAAGAFLVVRRRTVAGLALIATTAAVKITFLFLAPVLIVWAWRSAAAEGDRRPRAGLVRVLRLAGLGSGLHFVWLLPDWVGGSPLTALAELRGYAANSLTFALRRAILALGWRTEHLPAVMAAAFVVVVAYRSWELRTVGDFLRRVSRDVMLAFLVFLPVMHAWYAIAAFPPVVLGGARRHVAALVTLSGCFLLAPYGLRMLQVPPADLKLAQFLLGVLPAAVVFLFGTRWMAAPFRRRRDGPGRPGPGTSRRAG